MKTFPALKRTWPLPGGLARAATGFLLLASVGLATDTVLMSSKTESGLVLDWTEDATGGGYLVESASDILGPWNSIDTVVTKPAVVAIDGSGQKYFRLRKVTTVTVGIFQESGGNYTSSGPSLVFTISPDCQTWTRTAPPHDSYSTTHLHYNAADDTSYANGVFTWTEYGPEHSQGQIDATCAAGMGGVTKSVNATDYYQDHPGVFLKIISVN